MVLEKMVPYAGGEVPSRLVLSRVSLCRSRTHEICSEAGPSESRLEPWREQLKACEPSLRQSTSPLIRHKAVTRLQPFPVPVDHRDTYQMQVGDSHTRLVAAPERVLHSYRDTSLTVYLQRVLAGRAAPRTTVN